MSVKHLKLTAPVLIMALVLACHGCAATDSEYYAAPNDARYDHVNSIGMRLVYIPPGEFQMGSPLLEPGRKVDETPHPVKISRGYYMGIFEVTREQWRKFVSSGGAPAGLTPAYKNPGFTQFGGDQPVVNVSWHDAAAFCQWLSQIEGRSYRLPTEAEWEYAARAGSSMAFGNDHWTSRLDDNIDGIPWRGIYGDVTTPAGRFPPNAWGLYDMHGNVQEWCFDFYCEYPGGYRENPTGPNAGYLKVVRGGFFNAYPSQSRAAYRSGKPPTVRSNAIGFRVVMEGDAHLAHAQPTISSQCGNCLVIHAGAGPHVCEYAPPQHQWLRAR